MTTTSRPAAKSKSKQSKKSGKVSRAPQPARTTVTAAVPPAPTPSAPVAQAPTSQETTPIMANPLAEFSLVRVSKFGDAIYRRGDSRGSVKVSKTIIVGDAPATLDLVQFAPPGAARTPSPEKLAKLQEAAKKAQERAAKAQAKLDKLTAKATPSEVAASL